MSGFNQEIDFVVYQSESNISCCQYSSKIQCCCQKYREGKITFSCMIINQRDCILLYVLGGSFQNAFRKKKNMLPFFLSQQDQSQPIWADAQLCFAFGSDPVCYLTQGNNPSPTSLAGLEQHRLQHRSVDSLMLHF